MSDIYYQALKEIAQPKTRIAVVKAVKRKSKA